MPLQISLDIEYFTDESRNEELEKPFPDGFSLGLVFGTRRIEEREARQFPLTIYTALVLNPVFLTLYSRLLTRASYELQ